MITLIPIIEILCFYIFIQYIEKHIDINFFDISDRDMTTIYMITGSYNYEYLD